MAGRVAVALAAAASACHIDPAALAQASCPATACQEVDGTGTGAACRYRPKPDGTACDDGNPCTALTTCQAGACAGGSVLANGTACDDDDVCTDGDTCQGGQCISGPPLACGDPGSCASKGECDPKLGCVAGNVGPCVDKLASLPVSGCPLWAYTAPVQLGGTTFALLLDSGSTTTAVAAAGCSNCGALSPTYADGATSSYQRTSTSAGYVDGSGWQAAIYRDTARGGSAPISASATATAASTVPLRFASITMQTGNFFSGLGCSGAVNTNAYQGIWGLGPAAGARPNTDAFMDQLAKGGSVPNDAFAVQLCNLGGRMWLGGYDPAAGTGAVSFTPLLHGAAGNDNYYSVAIADVAVGATSLGVSSFAYGPAIVDTGTSGLFLPAAAYSALQQSLAQSPAVAAVLDAATFSSDTASDRYGYYPLGGEKPAQVDAQLPWLNISLPRGGAKAPFVLSLPPTQSYLAANAAADGGYLYTFTAYPAKLTILGASVLRQHVVIFDRSGDRIGFVQQAGWCGSALPTVQ